LRFLRWEFDSLESLGGDADELGEDFPVGLTEGSGLFVSE
jgi:hypothetical protein